MDLETLVLFQDSALLVINKPAGLPTLVDGYKPDAPYLVSLVRQAHPQVWIVHRLDRDTSGVIIFALSAAAHRCLNVQFEQRRIHKVYHALVAGEPSWDKYTVRLPLRVNGDRKHRTVVDREHGKPAHTELTVLERFYGYTLLEAELHTGRTHQIRAHLASLGYPIEGDRLYGASKKGGALVSVAAPLIERTALHARSLDLFHPNDDHPLHFEAPYSPDFVKALQAAARRSVPGAVGED